MTTETIRERERDSTRKKGAYQERARQNKMKTERKRDGMRRNKPKRRKNGSQRESVIQSEKHKCKK